jgi:hypothetical protein
MFAGSQVVPMTSCPAANRRGKKVRGMTQVAPATRILVAEDVVSLKG